MQVTSPHAVWWWVDLRVCPSHDRSFLFSTPGAPPLLVIPACCPVLSLLLVCSSRFWTILGIISTTMGLFCFKNWFLQKTPTCVYSQLTESGGVKEPTFVVPCLWRSVEIAKPSRVRCPPPTPP
jgi:hypothetical protein